MTPQVSTQPFKETKLKFGTGARRLREKHTELMELVHELNITYEPSQQPGRVRTNRGEFALDSDDFQHQYGLDPSIQTRSEMYYSLNSSPIRQAANIYNYVATFICENFLNFKIDAQLVVRKYGRL